METSKLSLGYLASQEIADVARAHSDSLARVARLALSRSERLDVERDFREWAKRAELPMRPIVRACRDAAIAMAECDHETAAAALAQHHQMSVETWRVWASGIVLGGQRFLMVAAKDGVA